MPALAKQPSTRPKFCSAPAIATFTDAGSETSQTWVSTLPGMLAIDPAAVLFFSALRPQIDTLHPALASACAMPSPIPPLPPVITAVRPPRSKMLMGRFRLFVLLPTMDKRGLKIKYGLRPSIPAAESTAQHSGEFHAVQTRHGGSRRVRRYPET